MAAFLELSLASERWHRLVPCPVFPQNGGIDDNEYLKHNNVTDELLSSG